jgi:hypothetical protein
MTDSPTVPWTECLRHKDMDEDCDFCNKEYEQIKMSARRIIEGNEALEDKLRREYGEMINPVSIVMLRQEMLLSLVISDTKMRAKFEYSFHEQMKANMEQAISEGDRKKLVSGIPGASIKPIRRMK